MTSNENELEELFHLAGLEPVENRRAFLESRCGDEEVREQVLRLLAQDDAGTITLLREGARPSASGGGERIDRYTLIKRLGEGGMGTVYLAHQEEPVRRDVALKTIRHGAETEAVVARFGAERQALAMMNHPGIAKVFDGGRTPEGLPYFVMEYVPGVGLSEYAARHRLTMEAFLELFRAICDAIQHAHQKGIIHRDLKPGNILIVEREGRGFPKVIDFGIARSLSGSLTGDDELTRGQVMGTYKYMSPEQADPKKGVDTRADIYALGVMLYEWLAGEPPFLMSELEKRSPDEAWRILLEKDPPTPSTRFGELDEHRSQAIAEHRHTQTGEWRRRLSGDLDWIVMKALAKDRSRRYASASELSADLGRHLADLPVSAGPPTGLYRAHKFIRRHRIAVASTVVVAASLIVGLGVALWSLSRVSEERDHTRRELTEARYQAEKAEAFIDFFDAALSRGGAGANLSLQERLERSSARTQDLFVERPEAEAAVRFTLAESYLLLGEDELALNEFRMAYHLQESALDTDPEHFDLMRTLMRLVETTRRVGLEEEADGYVRASLAKSRRILAVIPELELELTTLFEAAAGASQDAGRELEALRTVCAAIPGESSALSKALLRLVVEAVLNGSAGLPAVEILAPVAQSRIRLGSARSLVLEWQLAQLFLLPRFLDPDRALRTATELAEKVLQTLDHDHWLALDAQRLRGLAHAERWRATRNEADLASAEDLLMSACDRVAVIDGPRSYRVIQTGLGLRALVDQLGDDATRRAWLEASWARSKSGAGSNSNGWWPCSRPALPDGFRDLALDVLGDAGDPMPQRLRGYALARRGLYDQALQAFSAAGDQDDALTKAFRALSLAGLGRESEARALRESLGESGKSWGELKELLDQLDILLAKP